jgi:hypothetical protein
MKKLQKIKNFKAKRAKEIKCFAGLLETFNKPSFPKIDANLYEVSNKLLNESLDSNYWGYEVDKIEIEVETNKHIRPKEVKKAVAVLDILLEGDCDKWEINDDPFIKLNFRVTIQSSYPLRELNSFGFHIDRHHESHESDEIHPLYHLQYTHNPRNNSEFDYGQTLGLDVPRFVHYPLDLILGLSYLIAIFQPTKYKLLLDNREFVALLKTYQEKIWRPYCQKISNYWLGDANQSASKILCPYLV